MKPTGPSAANCSKPTSEVQHLWSWVRIPFPPAEESPEFKRLREQLNLPPDQAVMRPSFSDLPPYLQVRAKTVCHNYFKQHHPFLRCIVRRTRKYLEEAVNPETNTPYLTPIRVDLYGENEPVALEGSARSAYEHGQFDA